LLSPAFLGQNSAAHIPDRIISVIDKFRKAGERLGAI
jgi:hypothetical protein